MAEIFLEQNSPEWLSFRKDKLGASDMPIILNVSPWSTPLKLWEEKLGLREPPEMNQFMLKGVLLESVARETYNSMCQIDFVPKVFTHDELPYLMASLDGHFENEILEIKVRKKTDLPEHYYYQIQTQLLVSNAHRCHYVCYDDGVITAKIVERDEKAFDKIINAAKEFKKNLDTFTSPKETPQDIRVETSRDLVTLANRYKSLCETIDTLEEEKQRIKSDLLKHCEHARTEIGDLKVTKFFQRGQVDYKAIPELKSVDLEKYRKDGTIVTRITVVGR